MVSSSRTCRNRLLALIGIGLLNVFTRSTANDETWQMSSLFQGDLKLKEDGKQSPDTIPIIGTVEKPGIYWVPSSLLK